MPIGAGAPTTALGWVSYWNLLPLLAELQRQPGATPEVMRGTPAQVNRWLSEGKVGLAPSSSVCLVRNCRHQIAMPLGIASFGAVASVYIGLQHEDLPLLELIRGRQQLARELFRQNTARYGHDARKLAACLWKTAASLPPVGVPLPPLSLTPASETSVALGRILYRLWFGATPAETRFLAGATAGLSSRRPLELLIGDEALVRRPQFRAVIDLGEAWRDLTDLPFVFAVWQTAGQDVPSALRQRMADAAELAQARMRVEPSHYFPDLPVHDVNGHPIDLGQYWKHIHYRLGPAHFRSLALFLSLARLLDPNKIDDDAVASIMRWERFELTPQGMSSF